jgi:hypothetical protein
MHPSTGLAPSRHRVCLAGIASRYAPHLTMAGIIFLIGVGLLLLSTRRPDAGVLIPGAGFAVGGLLFLIPIYLGLSRHPNEVETSGKGLKWTASEGEHEADWDDIRQVFRYERITNQTFREAHLIVVLDDGVRLDLNQSLSDFNQLGDTVQTNVCARRAPKLRASLQSGGADFGPIVLRSSGLQVNGLDAPWDTVNELVLSRGSFNINLSKLGGTMWESVAIGAIPNFPVLMALLQEVAPQRLLRGT